MIICWTPRSPCRRRRCGEAQGLDAAPTELLTIIDRFVEVMVHPESTAWARFIVREQMEPTEAFEVLYGGGMGRLVDRLSALIVRIGRGSVHRRQGAASRCSRSSATHGIPGRPARPSSARPAGPTSMPPAPQQSGRFPRHTAANLTTNDRDPRTVTLKRLFPDFGFTLDHAPAIVRHIAHFGLAGLAAVAAGAEKRLMPRYLAALTIVLLLGMVLTRALLMKWRGIKAMRFGAIDKKDFLIPPFAFFYFYIVFAAAFDLPTVSTQVLFHSEVISWVGVVFCLAGLLLLLWSLVSFGQSFRVGIDTVRPDRLVTTGIFAFSRNPIYVAFAIVLIGQFLIFPNWILLAYLGAGTGLFHRQVLREEKYLRSHYGPEYSEYFQRVRRYL